MFIFGFFGLVMMSLEFVSAAIRSLKLSLIQMHEVKLHFGSSSNLRLPAVGCQAGQFFMGGADMRRWHVCEQAWLALSSGVFKWLSSRFSHLQDRSHLVMDSLL